MRLLPDPTSLLRRLWRFVYQENLHRILAVLVAMALFTAIALWRLEGGPGGPSFFDWLWWSIVTLTTVGYGDITPKSFPGRMIGVLLMFGGIGILSMLTATIASFLVQLRLRRERGMGSYDFRDHIVLCQWNHRSGEVLKELRSDRRTAGSPIVLIAEAESKPVDDELLYFVRGKVNEETLRRAGIERAATVVILGDNRLDAASRDAQVVLATLTVETLNPACYTIVEVVEEENVQHCLRARADEVIVAHQLSSSLMASAATDHGLSKVVSELLSQRYGADLRMVPLPASLAGREFFDAFVEMKKTAKSIVVAVQRGAEVVTNPASDYRLEAGDRLVAIVDRD
jgi:voltage-gated potassium channel